jgi:hypothetical protein
MKEANMNRSRRWVVSFLACLPLVAVPEVWTQEPGSAAKDAKDRAKLDNSNALIREHRKELKLSASSTWPGWPVENAFDGNAETSWFSDRDDTAAHGKQPWVEVTFPADVTVRRVTILGNRDPQWPKGYTILAGGVELQNKDGKRLAFDENDGKGQLSDFDFKFAKPVQGVRTIRFTALGDQGKQNPYDDIAIGEFQVE